jgi:hypothetical protein
LLTHHLSPKKKNVFANYAYTEIRLSATPDFIGIGIGVTGIRKRIESNQTEK